MVRSHFFLCFSVLRQYRSEGGDTFISLVEHRDRTIKKNNDDDVKISQNKWELNMYKKSCELSLKTMIKAHFKQLLKNLSTFICLILKKNYFFLFFILIFNKI